MNEWMNEWRNEWMNNGSSPWGPDAPRPLSGPLCPLPTSKSWQPCPFKKVPYRPQTLTSNVFRVQKEGSQINMSECRPGFTFTQNMGWGLLLCSTFPTQGTVCQSHYVCLLRVLCPLRRPETTLDCILLKDSSMVLATVRGPEINPRACIWGLVRPCDSIMCCSSSQHWIFLVILCLKLLGSTYYINTPETNGACYLSQPHKYRAKLVTCLKHINTFWNQHSLLPVSSTYTCPETNRACYLCESHTYVLKPTDLVTCLKHTDIF
jgi:hypothetical protein